MHGSEPGELYLPGVRDGACARRAELVNMLRSELRRFALTVSERFELLPLRGHARLAPPPSAEYDNPEHDPEYDRGFRDGWEMTDQECVQRLGPTLVEFRLMLGSDGTVTTLDVGMEILGAFRRHAHRARSGEPMDQLTDQALHAFLDGQPPSSGCAPAAADEDERTRKESEAPPETASESPGSRGEAAKSESTLDSGRSDGVASEDRVSAEEASATPRPTSDPGAVASPLAPENAMSARRTSRRVAVATLLGTFLAGTGLTALGFRLTSNGATDTTAPNPTNGDTPSAQLPQGPWVPPTTWDTAPASYRADMLAIDRFVHDSLARGQEAQLASIVAQVMRSGPDKWRVTVVNYVADVQEPRFLPLLMEPFGPAGVAGDPSAVQHAVIAAILTISRTQGVSAIPLPVVTTLRSFVASGASAPSVQTAAEKLVEELSE